MNVDIFLFFFYSFFLITYVKNTNDDVEIMMITVILFIFETVFYRFVDNFIVFNITINN